MSYSSSSHFHRSKSQGAAWRPVLLALTLSSSLILTACNGDDGDDGAPGANGANGSDGQDAFSYQPATIYVASNPGGGTPSVTVRNESLRVLNSYQTGGNEGLIVDDAGNLTQAGDVSGAVGVYTACNARDRSTGDTTRVLGGSSNTNTGFVNPKGITPLGNTGLIFVANVGASNGLVVGRAAAGDQAPVATVALAASPWDAVYDDTNDRLFVALTNGSVAVFDDFTNGFGAGGATRSFSSSTAAATSNLHGIDYDAASDRLVVSDVGAGSSSVAGFDTDGLLYVFEQASTLSGSVTPSVSISGSASRLGNPVDLLIDGTDVRIAEKANGGGAILIFNNVFVSSGGNVAPDIAFATSAPESLAVQAEGSAVTGATDVVDPAISYRLLTTSNPATGSATSGNVYATSRTLLGGQQLKVDTSGIMATLSIENINLDRNGDAYITFDDGGTVAGIAVVSGLGKAGLRDPFSLSRDRLITGSTTTLSSPKGVEIADDLGVMVVANFGGSNALVFSTCASGDAAPLATLNTAAAPWDSDYDPLNDTLYVALTNGSVEAYDNFSRDLGVGGPSRTIDPAIGGTDVATASGNPSNIHGIRYDQRSDTLILSDVGSGASSTDGALMTIEFAASADGVTDVGKRIAGALPVDNTGLGNPVDIAFDGVDLFVAEKANQTIQVWRNFLTDGRDGNVAPSASVDVSASAPSPESIVLLQNY
jgi:hypothetical protein